MKIMLALIFTVLSACAQHPSNEIEGLSEAVLSKDRGVSIEIVPLNPKKP